MHTKMFFFREVIFIVTRKSKSDQNVNNHNIEVMFTQIITFSYETSKEPSEGPHTYMVKANIS